MTHVFVFDIDDTLYLEHTYVRSGFRAVGEHLRGARGISSFDETASSLFEQGVRGNTFDRALAQLGLAHDSELVRELVGVYRAHAPEIVLEADATRALERCRALGASIAVISDGPAAAQAQKVRALGLRERVDVIVLSDLLGAHAWKPSELPYREVERAFSEAESLTYLADNPTKDFVTARRLGWHTVRVRRPGGLHAELSGDAMHEAHETVSNLDAVDFADIVRRMTHRA